MNEQGRVRGYAGRLGVLVIVCAAGLCAVSVLSLIDLYGGRGGSPAFGWGLAVIGALQLAVAIALRRQHRRQGR